VTSPDATPYVDLTLYDRDAQDIFADALANLQSYLPEWIPREGNTEVLLLETMSLIVEEQVFAINRIPGAIMEILLKLFGVTRSPGATPTTVLEFTLSDTVGHIIPIGTRAALPSNSDADPLVFTTAADLIIGSGDVSGTVAAVGDTATSAFNGTLPPAPLDLLDSVTFVESVVLSTNVAGGLDQEDDVAWFNRGVQRLSRLVETLVLPKHFVAAALEDPTVTRAFAVDSYDPGVGSGPGANPGHITVAVYGLGDVVPTDEKSALQAQFETQAQANLAVHVVDPTFTTVDVSATLLALPGYDPATVTAAAVAALTTYLAPEAWGWGTTVWHNELVSLLDQVEGVDRVVGITLPVGDQTLAGVAPLVNPGTFTITVTVP
jgi:hypothetical protein